MAEGNYVVIGMEENDGKGGGVTDGQMGEGVFMAKGVVVSQMCIWMMTCRVLKLVLMQNIKWRMIGTVRISIVFLKVRTLVHSGSGQNASNTMKKI